jgi:hypothetical protein
VAGLVFEATPQVFNGVVLRGIGRQEFDMQPRMMSEELLHPRAAMYRQAVPEQDGLAWEVLEELLQKLDRSVLIDGQVGMQSRGQTESPTAGAESDRSDRREVLLPIRGAFGAGRTFFNPRPVLADPLGNRLFVSLQGAAAFGA